MAATNTNSSSQMDPNSGFCTHTKIFHSLRPSISLPPPSQPLSATQFTLSLLHSTTTTNFSETPFLINASNGHRVTYSDFLHQTKSLAFSLQKQCSLSKGDVAFILSPNSLQIPSLYFSLLSLGVVIAPANPDDSISELTHQIQLSRPTIVFATSDTSHKLPPKVRTILIDSPEFSSLLTQHCNIDSIGSDVVVNQSDIAAIIHSSGTTGRNKGVLLSHGNFISRIAAYRAIDPFETGIEQRVSLIRRPLFDSYCTVNMMKAASMGATLVLAVTSDFESVIETAHNFNLNYCPVPPSFILAMVKSELTKHDLGSMRFLLTCGAPLGKQVLANFKEKFSNIEAYGLTEGGPVASMRFPDEINQLGSVGRLVEVLEAKIVDPFTGELLSPGQRGELWVRGSTTMKGHQCMDLPLITLLSKHRYPDEEAGQIPMAFVVRKPGSTITDQNNMVLRVAIVNMVIAVNDRKPANVVDGFMIDDVKALCAYVQIFICQAIPRNGSLLAHNLASVTVSSKRDQMRQDIYSEDLLAALYNRCQTKPGGGEPQVAGDGVSDVSSRGYVGDEKATAEAIDSEGWLKTGDLCFFDSDGFLFMVDRLKDVIKYHGYQVPPAELEHLLLSNTAIADAAVVPYPDEEAGQISMAFVVRKPGSTITDAQIMDYIAKQA
ncbi:hypothetical protein Dsin_031473 [Dipteronia sinensis]|uniref:Uncharacterized protein n=1 Tax=Dipteronia sinensis TaxID=43782 RepID=A0AAE0DSF6_9ROSI|nr:hypothetical protein Dsin_031473 [Dipteronia sinensis]